MRAVIFALIVAIVLIIAAVATGFLNINQTREAKAPAVTAAPNGITAKGGRPPAFDIETGSVKVGSKETTVKVPSLEVQKAGRNKAAAATTNAQ